MKLFMFLAVAFCLSMPVVSLAGDSVLPASSGVPVVLVSAAPSPSPSVVAVAEPAAPPQWAQDLISTAQSLPVVGPVVSKVLLYLGILSSILTLLAGFVLSTISVIARVSNLAGLGVVAARVTEFKSGPIMYWLKFFSLFNAQKKTSEPQA